MDESASTHGPGGPRRVSRRTFLGLGAAGAAGLVLGCGSREEGNQASGTYDERFRPQYHFTPRENWMNDPNGLVYYEGEYHLFFQHNPSGNTWDNISWGHAVSDDLVRWEQLPVALEPDDLGFIFSGSAVVDEEDTSGFFDGGSGLVAIYTNAGGKDYEEQVQSIAHSSDRGRTWTKYEDNPVIPNPGAEDPMDFRDPKVFWHAGTRRWVLLLAAGDRIMFYASDDLKGWDKLGEFGVDAGAHGGVWECPELLELPVDGDPNENRWVLQVDVNPGATEGGQYFVGDFDGSTLTNENPPDTILWCDHGKNFYATQDWSDVPESDGRRLWVDWMNNWQYAEQVPTSPWRSAMSVPREGTLTNVPGEGVRLVQTPVVELESLRTSVLKKRNLAVAPGENPLGNLSGQTVELVAEFDAGTEDEFGFKVLEGTEQETVVGYDARNESLFVDRSRSGLAGFSDKFAGRHATTLPLAGGLLKMRVFVDRSSVELFGNDGLVTITDQIFPDSESDAVEVYARGGNATLTSLQAFDLRSIWD